MTLIVHAKYQISCGTYSLLAWTRVAFLEEEDLDNATLSVLDKTGRRC